MGIPVAWCPAWYLLSTLVSCIQLTRYSYTYYDSYQYEILHQNHQYKKGGTKVQQHLT